jgi:hypothetical protein
MVKANHGRHGERVFNERKKNARSALAALWKPNGTHHIQGFTELIQVARIRDKAIIARGSTTRTTSLVYYPTATEGELFAEGNVHVTLGGYGRFVPGSVGMLRFKPHHHSGDSFSVDFMQGSFIQSKTPTLERRLVTKHNGWRHHLLRHFFTQEIPNAHQVVLKPPHKGGEKNGEIFIEIAQECGFTQIKKHPTLGIIARKPN